MVEINQLHAFIIVVFSCVNNGVCRDEEKIIKACYWPNEVYEPCFGGCAEVSCDNPRNHLRPCYPYCEPGCVCEDPYVRDDRTHQCVLPPDCSPTQMGIPVPSKRGDRSQVANTKYGARGFRPHLRRDEPSPDFQEPELPLPNNPEETRRKEDLKRPSEVSRMGNYFNIVIAPPPIKALQPRKLIQNNGFPSPGKRIS